MQRRPWTAIREFLKRLCIRWTGKDLDRYLLKLLSERGYTMTGGASMVRVAQDIKHRLCYVAAESVEAERERLGGFGEYAGDPAARRFVYEMPDGLIHLGDAACRCPEALFDPQALLPARDTGLGLPGHVHAAAKACGEELSLALLRSVVLAGGNTMFRGIGARMEKVLSTLAAAALQLQVAKRRLAFGSVLHHRLGDGCSAVDMDVLVLLAARVTALTLSSSVRVLTPERDSTGYRRFTAWAGGAALASSEPFCEWGESVDRHERWVTGAEYRSGGPAVVHSKCCYS
eukprot:COSAG02_NODE_2792_length_8019_cov_6.816793_2_plen_288_part_00